MVIFFVFVGSSYAYMQKIEKEDSEIKIMESEPVINLKVEDSQEAEEMEGRVPNREDRIIAPQNSKNSDEALIQKCPESWYVNEMPTVISPEKNKIEEVAREYFILDGARVETYQLDINWVMTNCEIKKNKVY
jgi:hypothetical protein